MHALAGELQLDGVGGGVCVRVCTRCVCMCYVVCDVGLCVCTCGMCVDHRAHTAPPWLTKVWGVLGPFPSSARLVPGQEGLAGSFHRSEG